MNKIFKYTIKKAKCGKHFVTMPQNAQVIRMGDVFDSFYQGSFVWAIVDTNEEGVAQEIDYKPQGEFKPATPSSYISRPLKIKEKQKIMSPARPSHARCDNDLPYLYCGEGKTLDFANNKHEEYQIAFYKTGQEIDLPVDKLKYLGICKLNIVQELGLYTFLVEE